MRVDEFDIQAPLLLGSQVIRDELRCWKQQTLLTVALPEF
jgi:hypothetical protein